MCRQNSIAACFVHLESKNEWQARGPFNGIAGFWISELYSPWKQLSEIVLDYLAKKDSAEDLKTFVNTTLAENWIEKGEAPEWEALLGRRMIGNCF